MLLSHSENSEIIFVGNKIGLTSKYIRINFKDLRKPEDNVLIKELP